MSAELEETELDARIMRRMADYAVETFKQSHNTILEQHSASYKWLLASLLAINGAGLLALFNASTMQLEYRLTAGVFFYLGVMSALLMAYYNQFFLLAGLSPIIEATAYWIEIAETGEFDEQIWKTVQDKIDLQQKKSKWSQIIGWLSFIAFSLALVTIACSYTSTKHSSKSPSQQTKSVKTQTK